MTKTKLLRMRLRFVLLLVTIVACGLISASYIGKRGGTYAYRLEGYGSSKIEESNIHIEPEGMARVAEVRQDPDGTYVAIIEGVAPGEGLMSVTLPGAGSMGELKVRSDRTVIVDGTNFTGWEVLPLSATVCFAVAGVLCVWAVQTLRAHAWYGYEMAAYAGGALFCLVEAASFAWIMLSGTASTTSDFAYVVTEMATRFAHLLLVPVAVMAVFVSASNVALVRYEGRRVTNLLGIITTIALAFAYLGLRLFDIGLAQTSTVESLILVKALDSVFSIGLCFALALLVGTATCAYGAARHKPSHPRDYLIVLGCGLRADGSPTPLLAGRVDAARSFAQAQEETGGPAPCFVPSGGQGPDEACSEAESMRRYLVAQGVDEGHVLLEDRSTNTRENFKFSAEVIAQAHQRRTKPRVAFATTNYHVFRGYVYAHDAGLDAEGISAPTKLYFWPNAFLREFVGLLASRALPIALSFAAIAGLYLLAEYALLLA